MKRDLLKLSDFSREEIDNLLKSATRLKEERKTGAPRKLLSGKTLGMVFNKASTRTRVSFEVGMLQLGGHAIVLSSSQLQIGRGETIPDTARTLSRYLDGLVVRTYAHEEIEELAREATIPVINALTDKFHPCQILADMMTIQEKRGSLDDVRVVYVGDGNNIANSWMLGAGIMGIDLTIVAPKGYEPSPDVATLAATLAKVSGATINIVNDPLSAAKDADVLYTDTWISMGQDDEAEERRKAFAGFAIDAELIRIAKPDVMVMHCLPAHRGEEISAEAMDGPHSVVWDQAENRLHVQKAVLQFLLG